MTTTPTAPPLGSPARSGWWARKTQPSSPTREHQAYLILWVAFLPAPVLFGVDKFFNRTTYWPRYLRVGFPHLLGASREHFMNTVGLTEVVAGLGVLFLSRLARCVVADWLGSTVRLRRSAAAPLQARLTISRTQRSQALRLAWRCGQGRTRLPRASQPKVVALRGTGRRFGRDDPGKEGAQWRQARRS